MIRHFAACLLFGSVSIFLMPASAQAEDDGFKSIFDGKTLKGWDGDPKHWKVEDGAITGEATKQQAMKSNTFIIWRQGEVDDFELKAEFKIVGGNSGIQYRSFENEKDWGRWVMGGYQADMDATGQWTGAMYEERGRGILATPGEKTEIGKNHKPKVLGRVADAETIKKAVHQEDWNEYYVVARGNHFVHTINGQVMSEVTDDDVQARRRSGIIALQLHAGFDMKVQFKNIRLKRLPLEQGKKVVFLAGGPSHGYGEHEFNAGCRILAKDLNESKTGVLATVYQNGWPSDPTAFDNANAVVLFSDGGDGHPYLSHLDEVDALALKGVGLGFMHYAVEIPKGKPGDAMLRWIGGYFETFWSVNPHWMAEFKQFTEHPISKGVHPFAVADEWYYNMRFAADKKGVIPILVAVPPDSTRQGKDGARSGNDGVRSRKGQPEVLAWIFDRSAIGGVGRGFGFTGGHVHWNWGNDGFRTVVLNAITWLAGAEVPSNGVVSKALSLEELEANQDDPKPKDFDGEAIRKRIESWGKGGASTAK